MGIDVTGDKVEGMGKKMLQKLRPAAARRVTKILDETYTGIVTEMRRPKHGRRYRKRGGRIHIASAPGEAPAIDTAHLINSLYRSGPNWKGWVVSGYIASTEKRKKLEALEFGTSKMEPRPIFRVVMRRVQAKYKNQTLKMRG